MTYMYSYTKSRMALFKWCITFDEIVSALLYGYLKLDKQLVRLLQTAQIGDRTFWSVIPSLLNKNKQMTILFTYQTYRF